NFGATVLSPPVADHGELFFQGYDPAHGTQLWATDGTAAGTTMLTNVNVANGRLKPSNLTAVGNTLYFTGGDSHGVQLWKSDGTIAGTTFVTSSNDGLPNFGIYPSTLTNVAGTLYFTGLDLKLGAQVFTSDGTAAGTAPVTTIGTRGCN